MNQQDTTIFRLKVSFLIMIYLIILIAGMGIYNVSRINDHLTTISEGIQEKLSLATTMRNNARERTLSLQIMVLTDDPFLRDDYWMLFNKFGANFARARLRLLEQASSDEEINILKNQSNLTKDVIPLQMKIAELSTLENPEEANSLLIEKALPMQNQVFSSIDQLYSLYTKQLDSETALAHDAYQNVLQVSWIAGVLALLLAIFTGRWITIRIHNYQDNLNNLNNNLESIVESRTKELKVSETRQRNVVENAIEGIIMLNASGNIESVNPAAKQLFNFPENELLGIHISKLLHPFESENTRGSGSKSIKIDELVGKEVELYGQKQDGSKIPILAGISQNSLDEHFHYSCFIRDITEQKRVEKLKNEFVSTVSHELRTPLTSIKGSLGLVIGGAIGKLPDKVTELLKLADNNVNRLLSIINDILDIQKIESGMMDFKLEPVKLTPILEQAVQDNIGYAKQYSVDISLISDIDSATVKADNIRLQQVLANLLSNAIKFSPAGSTVTLKLEKLIDHYRIWVIDNGAGISEEFQKTLFDKFTQEDSSTTRAKGGTGLGLPIVKVILENHESNLQFITEKNAGTQFYFDLKHSNCHGDNVKKAS